MPDFAHLPLIHGPDGKKLSQLGLEQISFTERIHQSQWADRWGCKLAGRNFSFSRGGIFWYVPSELENKGYINQKETSFRCWCESAVTNSSQVRNMYLRNDLKRGNAMELQDLKNLKPKVRGLLV